MSNECGSGRGTCGDLLMEKRKKGNEASPEGGTSLGGLLRSSPLGQEGRRFGLLWP